MASTDSTKIVDPPPAFPFRIDERFMSDNIHAGIPASTLVVVNLCKYVSSNTNSVLHNYPADLHALTIRAAAALVIIVAVTRRVDELRYERNYLAVLRCFAILSFGNSGQMIVKVYGWFRVFNDRQSSA